VGAGIDMSKAKIVKEPAVFASIWEDVNADGGSVRAGKKHKAAGKRRAIAKKKTAPVKKSSQTRALLKSPARVQTPLKPPATHSSHVAPLKPPSPPAEKPNPKPRRPYIFVQEVDIRPRQPQYQSVFEPVLVVEHKKYVETERVQEEYVEAVLEMPPQDVAEQAVLKSTVDQAPNREPTVNTYYNRILLSRTAIIETIGTGNEPATNKTDDVSTTAIINNTPKTSHRVSADDELPQPVAQFLHGAATNAPHHVKTKAKLPRPFRKLRVRLAGFLLRDITS
jgi:hypothetical protein